MNNKTNAARAATLRRHVLSLRQHRGNLNHHLWFNNGSWWMHYTMHLPDFTKERVRRPLGTGELPLARSRRDAILRDLAASQKEAT